MAIYATPEPAVYGLPVKTDEAPRISSTQAKIEALSDQILDGRVELCDLIRMVSGCQGLGPDDPRPERLDLDVAALAWWHAYPPPPDYEPPGTPDGKDLSALSAAMARMHRRREPAAQVTKKGEAMRARILAAARPGDSNRSIARRIGAGSSSISYHRAAYPDFAADLEAIIGGGS